MPGPTRDTTAGRVYNDLRNLARRQDRSTDAIMIDYVPEGFLFRLAASPLGGRHFVLKGGLLLSQFGARRMTRDINVLGREFDGNDAEIIRRIAGIAATDIDNGVTFETQTLKTTPIREDNEYGGHRDGHRHPGQPAHHHPHPRRSPRTRPDNSPQPARSAPGPPEPRASRPAHGHHREPLP